MKCGRRRFSLFCFFVFFVFGNKMTQKREKGILGFFFFCFDILTKKQLFFHKMY